MTRVHEYVCDQCGERTPVLVKNEPAEGIPEGWVRLAQHTHAQRYTTSMDFCSFGCCDLYVAGLVGRIPKPLNQPLSVLKLDYHTRELLEKAGLRTVGDLIAIAPRGIRKLPRVGPVAEQTILGAIDRWREHVEGAPEVVPA